MSLRCWITGFGAVLLTGLTTIGCTPLGGGVAAPPISETTVVSVETDRAVAPSPAPEIALSSSTPMGEQTTSPDEWATAGDQAMVVVESLAVKGRAPKTGYDRDEFGPAWSDTNHNGCDTRNDILARDLEFETFRPGTNDCVVLTGMLDDPYTATEIHFQRGQDTSTEVQIDHVVALSDAWQKGAQQLSMAERTEFANDPLNLLAVDGPANAQKGDGDAATWLPANRSFRCDYVARQIAVKARYDLWVTAAEKDAMAGVLSNCPGQVLPTDQTVSTDYRADTAETQSPAPAVKAPMAEPVATVASQVSRLDTTFTLVDILSLSIAIVSLLVTIAIFFLGRRLSFRQKRERIREIEEKVREVLKPILEKRRSSKIIVMNVDRYERGYDGSNSMTCRGHAYTGAELVEIRHSGVEVALRFTESYYDAHDGRTLTKTDDPASNVLECGHIPWEWIEDIDPEGDEFDGSPIFFVRYRAPGRQPYNYITYREGESTPFGPHEHDYHMPLSELGRRRPQRFRDWWRFVNSLKKNRKMDRQAQDL